MDPAPGAATPGVLQPQRAPRVGRLVTAGAMAAAGTLHLVVPTAFDGLVPGALGDPRPWTYGSGVVELACAALLSRRRTARWGATLLFVTLLAVWPGNWKAALDGGTGAPPPVDEPLVAWARVPLQLPMLWWAWRLRGQARDDHMALAR